VIRITRDLAGRLTRAIQAAQQAGELPDFEIPQIKITSAAKPEYGDYSSNTPLQIQGLAGMPGKGRQIAEVLVRHFELADYLAGSPEIAGSGFINFRLSEAWVQQQVDRILAEGETFGQMDDFAGQRAQVECVSANPTGPLHVGRMRGGVIGDAVARLLETVGYEVEMEYYFNNAGRQMQRLGESVRARYRERLGLPFEFPSDGYQGTYLYEISDALIAERGTELLEVSEWQPFTDFAEQFVFSLIRETLNRLRIHFDNYFNENSLYGDGSVNRAFERLNERGLTYRAIRPERDEGFQGSDLAEEAVVTATGEATWLRTRQLRGASQDVALIRSNGEPTYRLPDIAYHINKMERGFDLAVNILGADHIVEADDVRAALDGLGYNPERLKHIIHQFVLVQQGGEIRRGSTRAGDIIPVDDVVNDLSEQVGEQFAVDVIRFYFLKYKADASIIFDYEQAMRQSNENPVYYIQNAHVRSAGIARQAAEQGTTYEGGDVSLLTDPREISLIKKMVELPEVIERAVSELAPHKIAYWAHEELASTFHSTYDEIRALHGEVPEDLAKARLKLYAAAQVVFKRVLGLMGMSAPERM
jgi:arginyl-tRNA synthetase